MPSGRCPHCKRDTVFTTGPSVPLNPNLPNPQGLKRGTLSLDRCGHQDCRAVVYREHHVDNLEDQFDIYPPVEIAVEEEIPPTVARSYGETLGTFLDGHWNSAVQACRRALLDATALLLPEGIEDAKWRSWSLKRRIKELVDRHMLPIALGDWAEEIRAGAVLVVHGDEKDDYWATEEEATELIEFTKWVFRYVFVLPKQLERRRERLQKKPPESR